MRIWLAVLLLCASVAQAAHITDQLVVGLYPKSDLKGDPLQLLTTGMPVEVLKRGKGVVQVRLADDTKGWVEANYVSDDKPARMMLLEAQAELRRLKAQGGADGKPAADDLPTVAQAKLQTELEAARKRIAQLEQGQAELLAARLAQKDLEDLRERVAEAAALLGQPVDAAPQAGDEQGYSQYMPFIVAVVAVLIGFAAGVGFIDYRIRKRYGGFRI